MERGDDPLLSSLKYWVWLNTTLDLPAARRVYEHFGSPDAAFFADSSDYRHIEGLTSAQLSQLREKNLGRTEEILDNCLRHDVNIVTWQDASYPERLRNGAEPPLLYYTKGKPCQFDEEAAIALAGTRRATPYGQQVAFSFGNEIARQGGMVVTGIAGGCDYNAAVGALRAGGPLVCVTAGGVDVPYYDSASGRQLLDDISIRGTLVSLSPPGTPHLGHLFRRRNMFLTALTLGTVCIEAGAQSGTMQVARMAIDQSRDVYAVPANVGLATSAGTNNLLRMGLAIAVLRGSDVLEHYRHRFPLKSIPIPSDSLPDFQKKPRPERKPRAAAPEKRIDSESAPAYILEDLRDQFTDDELALIKALRAGPRSTDELIVQTELPANRATSAANLLLLRGYLVELPGTRFQLSDQLGDVL